MPSHMPRGLRLVRLRVPGILFAVLAITLATPALAMAPHKTRKKPRVPSCVHFPSAKMAGLIGVSSLEYEGKVTGKNSCLWKGPRISGEYSNLLEVEVVAKPEAEFFASEEQAKDDAAKHGYHFETIGGRGAATYFESYAITDKSLPPCEPGATLNEFGPPVCNPEPPWLTYTVVSYGALKPRGPEALVAVGLAGGAHVQKPIVIKLNQEILAGRIR